jgi:hypothetical protein
VREEFELSLRKPEAERAIGAAAYTVLIVTGHSQRSRLSVCVRVLTALMLLLLLTSLMVSNHHVPGPICLLLVPLFLSALPVRRERVRFFEPDTLRLDGSIRTALFQLPPPSQTLEIS